MESASRYPRFAIVGRPNVGKSSLLNALAKKRIAIVEPTAGVTRDRVSAVATHKKLSAEVIDTAGIVIGAGDELEREVSRQIEAALDVADAVIFVLDAREGLTAMDREAAELVRKCSKPVVLVANKVDTARQESALGELFSLGFGEPIPTAAIHGHGRSELFEAMIDLLGPESFVRERQAPEATRVALVGRRNAGKSTLVNRLVGERRVVVDDVPGTTRDAVDVPFEMGEHRFVLVDTAGVRKRSKIADSIEFYSHTRTEGAIRQADVVILVLDATVEVGRLDKNLGRYAADHYKPCIVALNKWDLADARLRGEFVEYIGHKLPGLTGAPLAMISALTGEGVEEMMESVVMLKEESTTRITTGELNRIVGEAVDRRRPKGVGGKIGKIYYVTQVDVQPPTLVFFINDKRCFSPSYIRYLEGQVRKSTPLAHVPIRIELREKRKGRGS